MSQHATRLYKPIGRCIYCRCVPLDVKLTKEHIIALSLGGYPILPEASCTDCAKITGEFERSVTRELLLPARTHFEIRSRKPKDRPKELTTTIGDVELARHPLYLAMEDFNYPEILGRPEAFPAWVEGMQTLPMRIHTTPDTGQRMDDLGKKAGVPLTFNRTAMRRTIAKTAHAFAVAELGEDAFEPYLPPTILGWETRAEICVGAIPNANNSSGAKGEEMPQLFHRLELRKIATVYKGDFLACEMTLFEPLGMPRYLAIVGRPIKQFSSFGAIASFVQDL